MAAALQDTPVAWPAGTTRFPFPHIVVDDFLPERLFLAYRRMLDDLLDRGLSAWHDDSRLSKMPGYDCHCWVFPPDIDASLDFFVTRAFQERMGALFGTRYTGEVSCQFNYHAPASRDGRWHDDYIVGYHVEEGRRPDGVNVWHYGCNLLGENPQVPGRTVVPRCRALAFLYYLGGERQDQAVDGGATALGYPDPLGAGVALFRAVAPLPNRLLAFECSPLSLHRNLSNRASGRALLIGWLHVTPEMAHARHGARPAYWSPAAARGEVDFNAP